MKIYRMAIEASVSVSFEADDEPSARAQAEAFRDELSDGFDLDVYTEDDFEREGRVYAKDGGEISVENIEEPDDELAEEKDESEAQLV